MKRLFTSIICLTLWLSAFAQQEQYENPVTHSDWPDPTTWRAEDGYFYSMATGGGRLLRSTNLAEWQQTLIEPFSQETWDTLHTIGRHLWAPDVTVVNGRRLAYVTMYNSAGDASIVALREVTPGHFEFASVITQGKNTKILDTIDPEVVTDPETGKVWLFFGSIGGVHRIELTQDGLSKKKGARYEHVAGVTMAEDGSRLRVFEGSYLYKRGKYWYLFVSSGWYNNATYRLSVGRSKRLDGTFVDREGRPMTEGYATLLLHSEEGDRFLGPGHCGEITTDDEGHDFIVYHCHDRQMQNGSPRPMMLQRIYWDKDGWPYFEDGKPSEKTEAAVFHDQQYRLVWSEEFDKDGAVDTTKWNFEEGFERNHELQWYCRENAYQRDGLLIIEAREADRPNPLYREGSRDWRKSRRTITCTSSSINTRGKYSFTYGRMEVRARIPIGDGAWPAIWLLGDSLPWPSNGEIDVMEFYRKDMTDSQKETVQRQTPVIMANAAWATERQWTPHWNSVATPLQHFTERDPFWATRFHTWVMDWDEHAIRIYLDGEALNEIDLSTTVNQSPDGINPFHRPQYILLNLAVGGDNGGEVRKDGYPLRYEVDYVRVYQKK